MRQGIEVISLARKPGIPGREMENACRCMVHAEVYGAHRYVHGAHRCLVHTVVWGTQVYGACRHVVHIGTWGGY